jgi:CubicO group peptidase (beta-lactamase class C family)
MTQLARVAILTSAALATALAPVAAQSAAPADSLVGIWVSENLFGPSLRGELTVTRNARGGWRAAIGGATAAFRPVGDSVRFDLGGRGSFHGVMAAGGRTIDGWWVQPAGDPNGMSQAMASPLVLRRAADGAWRGTVRPLDDRFTLYLRIFRGPDGGLLAAFRNPEMNSRGGVPQFRVRLDGDSVRFTARPDTSLPEFRQTAALVGPGRMRIAWADAGRTLELTRATPAQAAGFFPRPPGSAPYAYRQPPLLDDGWTTARGRDVGLDEAVLARMVQRIIDSDPSARRPTLMHSFLLARRGKLVLEEYFYGTTRDTEHDIRSAGKTLGSVMLGAAMRRGTALTPESRIYPVLAGMGPFANPDPRKGAITLAHLMTHTPGLACDDNDEHSPGAEGTMQAQTAQPNWWKYTLDLPTAHDPGTRYAYCSANPNLLGAALTVTTHTWLPELFDRTVAGPLQFSRYYWNLMPTGEGYLGGGAFIRPRDLLKVGQAYLDGGVWHGRRIVDSAWVALSTAPHAEVSPETTGLSAEDFGNFYGRGADGYLWHLGTLDAGGRTYRTYAASGNGGQLVIVIPEAEMVAVFTGANYGQGGIWGRWGQEILGREVIPSMRP